MLRHMLRLGGKCQSSAARPCMWAVGAAEKRTGAYGWTATSLQACCPPMPYLRQGRRSAGGGGWGTIPHEGGSCCCCPAAPAAGGGGTRRHACAHQHGRPRVFAARARLAVVVVVVALQVDKDTMDMLKSINLGSLAGVTVAQVSKGVGPARCLGVCWCRCAAPRPAAGQNMPRSGSSGASWPLPVARRTIHISGWCLCERAHTCFDEGQHVAFDIVMQAVGCCPPCFGIAWPTANWHAVCGSGRPALPRGAGGGGSLKARLHLQPACTSCTPACT